MVLSAVYTQVTSKIQFLKSLGYSKPALEMALILNEPDLVKCLLRYGARRIKYLKNDKLVSRKFYEDKKALYRGLNPGVSKAKRNLFLLAKHDQDSLVRLLPHELIEKILTSGRIFSRYHLEIVKFNRALKGLEET